MGDEVSLQSIDRGCWSAGSRTGAADLRSLIEIRIIKGVVSKDHVHILVSAPPELSVSDMMRHIKGRSSSKLFEEFPELKKRYWGRHFWARGYFCVTVGDMTEDMIKEYLDHHFEPDPARDFRVEP